MTHPALSNPITEDDIANYLVNNPDFFVRHAELLAAVQFTSPHSHRAVSLQERQAEMLRAKIKVLEQRMMEVFRNGNENVIHADKVLRWARTLFLVSDPLELPNQIMEELQHGFNVPQVGMRIWGVGADYANLAFAQGVSEDTQIFAGSLAEPLCGPTITGEALSWLPQPEVITSMALIPLRSEVFGKPATAFGMIALGSPDALRFQSDMGTEFLQRIGEIASASLFRLR